MQHDEERLESLLHKKNFHIRKRVNSGHVTYNIDVHLGVTDQKTQTVQVRIKFIAKCHVVTL